MKAPKTAIVLPVHNEAGGIVKLLDLLEHEVPAPVCFVLVDDASTDSTLDLLKSRRPNVSKNTQKIVVLSRNFGHQCALMAGLEAVPADAERILVMDADLQDRPKDVPALLAKFEEGYDCVYAVRKSREEGLLLKLFSKFFYWLQSTIASFSIPRDAGTFSVFNRKVLEKILDFKETDIYFPGLRAYVGFRQTGVRLKRGRRESGRSRVGIRGLIHLSILGLIGFSAAPMRMIFLFGIVVTGACGVLSLAVLGMKLFGITQIPGVTTTLIVTMTLAGIQSTFIGIVGEYLGRLFREAKQRPRWIVMEVVDGR